MIELNIKKVKPMFTSIVTTMNIYEDDRKTSSGIIDTSKQRNTVKEFQQVISVGDSVRGIKVGDLVCVDPTRFYVKKHNEGSLKNGVICDNPVTSCNFDVIFIDGKNCLLLRDSDIKYVVEEYDEVEINDTDIYIPDNKIIA